MTVIKNIIFDLGGVLLNINPELTIKAFESIGITNVHAIYSTMSQDAVFTDFEKGLLKPFEFREYIRKYSLQKLSDLQIDNAWSAMILDYNMRNISTLIELKNNYNLFLLSNTNEIHEKKFRYIDANKKILLTSLFHKIYYSYRIKTRKPEPQSYKMVIEQNNLVPSETIFIDDSDINVKAANQVGLLAVCYNGESFYELLKNKV